MRGGALPEARGGGEILDAALAGQQLDEQAQAAGGSECAHGFGDLSGLELVERTVDGMVLRRMRHVASLAIYDETFRCRRGFRSRQPWLHGSRMMAPCL